MSTCLPALRNKGQAHSMPAGLMSGISPVITPMQTGSYFMHRGYMELRSLRHFVVLAHHLNYSRAAAELGLTQPALSRSIQSIEAHYNVKLFNRNRGGVQLTQVGQSLVGRAVALLKDAESFDRILQRTAEGEEGEIKFGIAPFPARVLLPGLLTDGLETLPGLYSDITLSNPIDLFEQLAAGRFEFIVCTPLPGRDPAFARETLLGFLPLSLLVRRGHPLLEQATAATLHDFPFVTSGPINKSEDMPVELQPYISRQPHIILNNLDILAKMTCESDAVWLSSRFAAVEEISQGLLTELAIPGVDLGLVKVCFYMLERRSMPPLAALYLHRFRQQLASCLAVGV